MLPSPLLLVSAFVTLVVSLPSLPEQSLFHARSCSIRPSEEYVLDERRPNRSFRVTDSLFEVSQDSEATNRKYLLVYFDRPSRSTTCELGLNIPDMVDNYNARSLDINVVRPFDTRGPPTWNSIVRNGAADITIGTVNTYPGPHITNPAQCTSPASGGGQRMAFLFKLSDYVEKIGYEARVAFEQGPQGYSGKFHGPILELSTC